MCFTWLHVVLLAFLLEALNVSGQRENRCPAPTLDDGFVVPDKETHLHGTTISYRCEQGRKPHVGGWWASSTCHGGTWTHTPQCIDVNDCLGPEIPNAEYTPVRGWYKDGEGISCTCDEGYDMRDRMATATCSRGNWTSLPNCDEDVFGCTEPDEIPHAVILHEYRTRFSDEKAVPYECVKGFSVAAGKSKSTLCAMGQWEVDAPCVKDGVFTSTGTGPADVPIVRCGRIPTIQGGEVKLQRTSLTYQCADLYELVGTAVVVCYENRTWSQPPICRVSERREKRCPAPRLEDGFVVPDKETHLHGTTISYRCEQGRKPNVGGWWATSTCHNGTWTHTPQCKDENLCLGPEIPKAEYTPHHGWYKDGDNISITCDQGYGPRDAIATATCRRGKWTSLPVCDRDKNACTEPDEIPHAVIIDEYKTTFPDGRNVSYECEKGFSLDAGKNKSISCSSGQWIVAAPCVTISCDYPGDAQFADVFLVKGQTFDFGSEVAYKCKRGYQMMSRINKRRCTQNGWEGVVPVCTDHSANRHSAEPKTDTNLTLDINPPKTNCDALSLENDQLKTEKDQLKTENDQLKTENDQLKTNYDTLMREKNQLTTNYDTLMREKNQLQSEVNQLRRQTTEKRCSSGWKKFGSSCYYRSTERKTWQQAREYCLSQGADLVIINSGEEQEFIRGLWTGSSTGWYGSYIGLKRAGGTWTSWVDGTPLTTQYWGSGWPGNYEDCAAYNHYTDPGTWFNTVCSYTHPSICEK